MIQANGWQNTLEVDSSLILNQIKGNLKEKIYKNSQDINLYYLGKRPKVISFLKRLCENYNLSHKTYNAALRYVDIVLVNNKHIKFDLAAIACMILAVKFIENSPCIPVYSKFLNPKKEFYSKEEITFNERECVKLLDYKLSITSAYDILQFFLFHEKRINSIKFNNGNFISQKDLEQFNNKVYKVLDFFNEDIRSLDFTPWEVALSALLLASKFINKRFEYRLSLILEKNYGINLQVANNCLFILQR